MYLNKCKVPSRDDNDKKLNRVPYMIRYQFGTRFELREELYINVHERTADVPERIFGPGLPWTLNQL